MYHSVAQKGVNNEDIAFFRAGPGIKVLAVADGHGGEEAVRVCERCLSDIFSESYPGTIPTEHEFFDLFKRIHGRCDGLESGTTLTLCVIDTQTHQFGCANVGDSHCLQVTPRTHLWMSTSHRLQDNALERERVKAHTRIDASGRSRLYPGGLSCSRFLGDYDCPHIDFEPAVCYGTLNQYDALVIASDGIWDRLGIKRVCSTARQTRCATSILRCKASYTDDATVIVASREPPASKISLASLLFRTRFSSSEDEEDSTFVQRIAVPI